MGLVLGSELLSGSGVETTDLGGGGPSVGATTESAGPPAEPRSGGGPFAPANYEVLEEIGRGGMGEVYKVRHKLLQRVFALKVIRGRAAFDAGRRERFLREARALMGLRHPNVVQIYEVGEAAGCPYFSMEYVEGGNLAQKLKQDGLPTPSAAAQLVETLALAIEAAHKAGVLHR